MIGCPEADAALSYAAYGWPVFPLRGKLPARSKAHGGRGFHDASTDPAVVEAMWTRYPGANVGVRTGETSGLAVLDVDAPAGIVTLTRLETERGVLPGTVLAMTGSGGMHFLYRHRPGLGIGAAVWGPGLDLRGEGGYIVVAPSVHPGTGEPYRWAGNIWQWPLPDWPAQLPVPVLPRKAPTNVVTPLRAPADKVLAGLLRTVLTAEPGTRNSRLNWAVSALGWAIENGAMVNIDVAESVW